jgi:hypothetical protein
VHSDFPNALYKLPGAISFVSKSTAVQHLTTLHQPNITNIPTFTKLLDILNKNAGPNFTKFNNFPTFSVTKINLHFQEVKLIQFLEAPFDAALFTLKLN